MAMNLNVFSHIDEKKFVFHVIGNILRAHVLLIINLRNSSQGHSSLLNITLK